MKKRLFGVLAAGLAVAGLRGVAAAGEASAASTTVSQKTAAGGLQLMTPTQYRAALHGRAVGTPATGVEALGQAMLRPNDPPTPWYEIYVAYRDRSNRDIPVRQGYSDLEAHGVDAGAFGFNHACFDHNLCNYVVFQKGFTQESGTSVGSNRYQYELYLVDSNLNIDVDILLVQTQNRTDYEGETTPDGRPIGLITGYCRGYTNCPEAVNEVS